MPSQDDYLDDLLKGMSEEENNKGTKKSEEDIMQELDSLDLDAVTAMTEEDIARLLEAGVGETANQTDIGEDSGGDISDSMDDVLNMLEGTSDSDLQEIQDLLQKSDRNEMVDPQELLDEEENPADKLMADIERAGNPVDVSDPKQQRAMEKQRRKEEKLARKAEKKAKKEAAKSAKGKSGKKASKAGQDEMPFDKDILDSIVSGDGQIGKETAPQTEKGENRFQMSAEDAIVTLETEEADDLLPDISVSEDDEEGEKDEKPQGLFAKFMAFIMEEDEEPENEDIRLSKENQDIIDELDREKAGGSAKGKDKKKKKEKPKKEPKPKKPPKPKKEKPPKEEEPVAPGSRLTLKKALPIILLGVTVGAVIFIFVNVSVDYADKQIARRAYREGNYEVCYQNLFGKKRNEEEALMFGKSESILYIRRWYREYEILATAGSEVEALDSLIQTVTKYPALYEYAYGWNAVAEVNAVYSNILNILNDRYGITELQALEIAAEEDDLEYTRIVTALAKGLPYGSWNVPQQPSDPGLPNELPEESNMGGGNFVDNQ